MQRSRPELKKRRNLLIQKKAILKRVVLKKVDLKKVGIRRINKLFLKKGIESFLILIFTYLKKI